jgi:glutamate-1-semialdehyde aminotransferase
MPDIACFAKGISNGMPLAAVAGKREIMEATKDVTISSTYSGDALSFAAAVACIKEYREKDVTSHLWKCGEMLVNGMNKVAAEVGLSLEFVGYPQMSAYSFGYEDPEVNNDLTTLFMQEMASRGILIRRGGLICVTYSHKKEDIDRTIDACREVFPKLLQSYRDNSIKNLLKTKDVAQGIRKF